MSSKVICAISFIWMYLLNSFFIKSVEFNKKDFQTESLATLSEKYLSKGSMV